MGPPADRSAGTIPPDAPALLAEPGVRCPGLRTPREKRDLPGSDFSLEERIVGRARVEKEGRAATSGVDRGETGELIAAMRRLLGAGECVARMGSVRASS
jgi:hypothetical protein